MKEELQCKIVIFEDDQSILLMLADYFRDLGTEVVTYSDGDGAVETIRDESPDLVIMDVVMPVQDGFTIVKALRKAAIHIPVILLTDQNSIDDRVIGLNSGADDYLCKPFSPKELLARAKALLRRTRDTKEKTKKALTFQELHIDPFTREIKNRDNNLPLTKTEFELLYFLIAQFPGVASRQDIYKEVLGYRPDVETKALAMHVMNLRRKLKNSQVTSFEIKAVAGVGYKLIITEQNLHIN